MEGFFFYLPSSVLMHRIVVYLLQTLVLSETEDTEPTIVVEDALEEIEEVLQKVNHDEMDDGEREAEDKDVVLLDKLIEKTKGLGKKKQFGTSLELGHFELELNSVCKQAEDDEELEIIESENTEVKFNKTPETSGRCRYKRTSNSSQKSNERMEEKLGKTEIRGSPKQLIQSIDSCDVLEVKATDDAKDSMVSDSCDSDASAFVIYPNIEKNIKTPAMRNETEDDLMSPAIERVQTKKKKQTRRNLMKDETLVADKASEDTDVYTFIMSPAKKAKSSEEGESSQKEEEIVHVTRSRLRRKTLSDLQSQSKAEDSKIKNKRKSMTTSGNSSSEKNSKITEYFKGTPIRTRGKVICKNEESVELGNRKLSDDQQSETNEREPVETERDRKAEESETSRNRDAKGSTTRRSTRIERSKDKRIQTPSKKAALPAVEELKPRRTRSQSESKFSENVLTQKDINAEDITNLDVESLDEDSVSTDNEYTSTPRKRPMSQRVGKKVLRSRRATPTKGNNWSETSSSSVCESFSTDTPRKSLRSRKT